MEKGKNIKRVKWSKMERENNEEIEVMRVKSRFSEGNISKNFQIRNPNEKS